ncbi:PP2C family protein-serine/threonine phosphatase [Streptomyces litchfieldiae]|uniref:PP2C family protein-serine/threonine phosphatase n=1 Tax=Streptomyces litchfieldiae TaxID=3075543 RepID=A0ABU2MUJ4_9ACTN|nr:PP2C family protein-serine/threonine phosphatase [Streptomyces sp. DSM 44938]MDT0344983.1 PP2C family protein-serine/threonine phosphatase [Streptomyces sp. DSM 44938]
MPPPAAPGLMPRWLRALPVVLLIVTGVVEWVVPGWVQLAFLFAALPPLTGLIYGPRMTALLGVAALLLLVLPATRPPHVDDADLGAVGAISVGGVLVSWIRSRYLRDLVVVRNVAEAVQRAVLPPLPERVGDVRCAGLYRAAQVGALVGGDLYDLRASPFGVRALVADVQGHGLAAVATVAALLGAFREAVLDEADLGAVAARLDRRLVVDAANNADEQPSELFATALLLEFPPGSRQVRLVNCGHPPPLLVRGGEARELSADAAPPLGLGAGQPSPAAARAVSLRAGDVLLGYTDGVTEARDASGEFYPLPERLAGRLGHEWPPGQVPPLGLVEFVWRDVTEYAGAITDDVALLALSLDRPQT